MIRRWWWLLPVLALFTYAMLVVSGHAQQPSASMAKQLVGCGNLPLCGQMVGEAIRFEDRAIAAEAVVARLAAENDTLWRSYIEHADENSAWP